MSEPDQANNLVAGVAPAAEAPPVTTAKAAAKLELLDGDEIIQLSIKPSLWLIPLVSLNLLAAIIAVTAGLAVAMRAGYVPETAAPFQILAGLAGLRLAVATLQWASRLYVLTNRRVMRFKGTLNVEVAECRLTKISQVDLHIPSYGWALRLGSIRLRSAEPPAASLDWDDVARPQHIHEILVRAIRKAQT
jgi:hypothetical protein